MNLRRILLSNILIAFIPVYISLYLKFHLDDYLCSQLGFLSWTPPTGRDISKQQGEISWPLNYAALLDYRRVHGHCNVPHGHFNMPHRHCNIPQRDTYECVLVGMGEGGSDYRYVGNLGTWLHSQRSCKKGTRGYSLSSDREALLQKLVDQGIKLCLFYMY